MRVATFNVQNLRVHDRNGQPFLHGAHDDDAPDLRTPSRELDQQDRDLTAQVITQADADVIALQEVFDQETLDFFHERLLVSRGMNYPYRVCLEGNDGRSFDVAVMSRLPLENIKSHADLQFSNICGSMPEGISPDARIFRRDCLSVKTGDLHLFICHLKAAPSGDDMSHTIRRMEAAAIRHVVEATLADPATSLWLVLGDFNAHRAEDEADLATLTDGFVVDLFNHSPKEEHWTYYHRYTDSYTSPDRLLASPALAAAIGKVQPTILRTGLPRSAACQDERLTNVGKYRPHASDHALVWIDIPAP